MAGRLIRWYAGAFVVCTILGTTATIAVLDNVLIEREVRLMLKPADSQFEAAMRRACGVDDGGWRRLPDGRYQCLNKHGRKTVVVRPL